MQGGEHVGLAAASLHVALWGALEKDTSPGQTLPTGMRLGKQRHHRAHKEQSSSLQAISTPSCGVDLASESWERLGPFCTLVHSTPVAVG